MKNTACAPGVPNIRTALELARLCEAVYPGGGYLRELLRLGFQTIVPVPNEQHDSLAVVASGKDAVLVVFRGTANERNVVCDIDVDMAMDTTPPYSPSARLHKGFDTVFRAMWPDVDAAVQSVRPLGSRKLYVCGHSLGGALAMVCAGKIDAPCSCYTYGQPRTGNAAWCRWFEAHSQCADYFRFVDREDFVPRVPWLLGSYRHCGTRVLIDAEGRLLVDPPLWRTLVSDAAGCLDEMLRGHIAMVNDHHARNYTLALQNAVTRRCDSSTRST